MRASCTRRPWSRSARDVGEQARAVGADQAHHRARDAVVLDAPHGMVSDSFEVIPADPRQAPGVEDVERKLAQVLAGPLDGVRPD